MNQNHLDFYENEKIYTCRNIDCMYFIGVFNVSGIDGLKKEIERLKAIGRNPYTIIDEYANKESLLLDEFIDALFEFACNLKIHHQLQEFIQNKKNTLADGTEPTDDEIMDIISPDIVR